MKINLGLTKKQQDKIWGETGPYSEARLIFCSRILDDQVSRVFVEVEVAINPLTFEMVKKNRQEFANDPIIQQLLDHSDFRGQKHGYVSSAFSRQYIDHSDALEAERHLQYAKETIIRMHKWLIRNLNKELN